MPLQVLKCVEELASIICLFSAAQAQQIKDVHPLLCFFARYLPLLVPPQAMARASRTIADAVAFIVMHEVWRCIAHTHDHS